MEDLVQWANSAGFTLNNGRVANGSDDNALRALVFNGWHTRIKYNAWTGRTMVDDEQLRRDLVTTIKANIEDNHRIASYIPTRECVRAAIDKAARWNTYNPRLTEISKPWDEKDRYPALALALNQDPSDYLALEIVKLLVRGAVVRVVYPGAEFQYCPILYSKQGVGKGDFLKILSGGYHSELIMATFSHPNAQQQMMERFRGKNVVEVGEFAGVTGRALDTMKIVVGDSEFAGVRAAYGEDALDWPMTAIMVGTTNKEHILTDDENRRHPVLTIEGPIDLVWIGQNIEQLWAQAHHEYQLAMDLLAEGIETDGILVGNSGRPRVQIPRQHWQAMAERTERHRQPSELEDWLRDEYLPAHVGYLLRGQKLNDAVRARFGRVITQDLSHAMRSCEWHKFRITLTEGKVTVWAHSDGHNGQFNDIVPLV